MVATAVGALIAGPAETGGAIRHHSAAHTASIPAAHGRMPVHGWAMATAPGNAAAALRVELLRAVVRETFPHDPRAFTQGLEFRGATLYESTGLVGQSSLRAGPPGKPPTRSVGLPAPLFGEGITLSGARLWQLTWRNGIAIERDPTTLAERRRVSYRGEGWGLCHQHDAGRERLVMSDGTDRLTFRDPDTFTATGGITVQHDGAPATGLNELECAPDGFVYANVYPTNTILRIDPDTGTVVANIDAAGLLTASERRTARQLNGIAAVPGTDGFLITGKLWPHMFRVTFVPR
ncbi:glutaminyl-peptide cyclotransferase [Streptomyces sp. RerS4]|uniref:glutaminyl-peptide cyclotransferase n=1 Tax=Streptomyces sp. RerS4 TaxID=2942449 RepID=UPI00201BF71A|nr:glutaminyl-peptide cyclotransferase [Streptomyces sp. RerS4]UQW99220.1 glutaminyl-peptide cyclotransferase [Streptomyces sp. RerS4]